MVKVKSSVKINRNNLNKAIHKAVDKQIDSMTFDINCPHCDSQISVKEGYSKCPSCHDKINLTINRKF